MARKLPTIEAVSVQGDPRPKIQDDHTPPAADHIPPQITGKDLIASFKNLTQIVRKRRLEALARTYPEVAALLKAKVKTPTAEAPRIES